MKLTHAFSIENNEIDALITQKIIQHIAPEIHVVHFTHAKSALQALQQTLSSRTESFPQLILLDLYMPGMDGWQFLEKYREITEHTFTCAVTYLVTHSNDIDIWIKGRSHQLLENVLLKPFTHSSFRHLLNKHFINS